MREKDILTDQPSVAKRNIGQRLVKVEAVEQRTLFALLEFAPALTTTAGADVLAVAPGDYNSDGKLDLIVANGDAETIGFLAGLGDGNFAAPVTFPGGAGLSSVAGADLNSDGKRDLIITGQNTSVALGNGDGTFAAAVQVASGGGPQTPAVAQIDGDGSLDLAIPNASDDSVSILYGNGDGTFSNEEDFAAGTAPISIAAGDFDIDGDLDFAVANAGASADGAGAGVTLLANNGSGVFQAQSTIATPGRPAFIDVGPLNADGELDLVVSNGGPGTGAAGADSISVLIGGDALSFAAPVAYPTGAGPSVVRIGNFNLDNRLDVATVNRTSGDLAVFINTGDGVLATSLAFPATVGSNQLSRADVNGDGSIDLVIGNGAAGSVSVLLNETDPTGPTAAVDATQAAGAFGAASYDFTVTYTDANGIDGASLGDNDVLVVSPAGGAGTAATFIGVTATSPTTATVTYRVAAPGGTLDAADNGAYTVTVNEEAVFDTQTNPATAGPAGTFALNIIDLPPGPAPDLAAAVSGKLPTAVVSGAKGSASVVVTNTGDAPVDAAVRVSLLISSDTTADGGDTAVGTPVERRLKLKAGGRKVVKLKFLFPNVPDGSYSVFGVVDGANAVMESNEGNNTAAAPTPVTIQHAFVDLTGSLPTTPATPVTAGQRLPLSVIVQNSGSVSARGSVTFSVVGTDPANVAADVPLGSATAKLNLKPGASKTIRLKLPLSDTLPAGSYTLGVTLAAVTPLVDENPANDQFMGTGVLQVG